ncbi:MAG: GIY-YIG nuclease family protein [archaeon]
MSNRLFPKEKKHDPRIYAYIDTNPNYDGLIKVGFTSVSVEKRVDQQYPTKHPGEKPYRILVDESAMRKDGSSFTDHEVHKKLKKMKVPNRGGEWFECDAETVLQAINLVKNNEEIDAQRTKAFSMRPEQEEAVRKTKTYFTKYLNEDPNTSVHFLWNAKMRFGKTFTAYQLVKSMNWDKVLVLTFKPAVEHSWEEDLMTHKDFQGWQFYSKNNSSILYEDIDFDKPLVCLGSFQDYLGTNEFGGIKTKNEWVHKTNWDIIIFDEYHYGAWRERAQDLFNSETKKEREYALGEEKFSLDNETKPGEIMQINSKAFLYLSGTPFKAIASGEFIEDQIYNWTYSDEQRAKENWVGSDNPYLPMPQMALMTYQMPETITEIAMGGEFDEFDLNIFFEAEGRKKEATFTHENEVQKWLDLIRGGMLETTVDNLKMGARKPPLPFSDVRLLEYLNHTFWFLPSVSAVHAMANLLKKPHNKFFHDYEVIIAAGPEAGIGADALPPVYDAMNNPDPLKTKTITLSCGKLTTGVTVRPWTGIFMLRNTSSPETYFQAAFRVQSPWVIKNPDGISPNKEEILKELCYVFDFAPNRALRQIQEYSFKLNVNESNPEKKVDEFINFLPVLAYDGSSMRQINASEILDIAMSGTTASLLSRRWESALLVNVDNMTLKKLLNNEKALNALMNIEGFRSLNKDIETIINKSEKVKEAKRENDKYDPKKRKELSQEEKEYKSMRKKVQEKLVKFATKIPVYMYLTD